MKTALNIFILLFFCLNHTSVCQEKDSILYWSAQHPLTWEDFEGVKPDKSETGTARSHIQVQALPSLKSDGNYDCLFFATFIRNKSFSTTEDLNLLKHEQVHFDIQELFVRKARKYYHRLKKEDPTNASICKDAFLKYYDELNSYQELYDLQTNHSRQKYKQRFWNLKILNELKSLEDFSIERSHPSADINKKRIEHE